MLRPLVAACWLLCAAAPAAAAPVTRYVDTNGDDTANDCSASGSPCKTLAYAFTQAASGDEVIVAAGTYDVTGELSPNGPLYLHGELSGARPVIRGAGGLLQLTWAGTTVRHLAFEVTGTSFGAAGIEAYAGNILLDDIDVSLDNLGSQVNIPAIQSRLASPATGTLTLSNSTVSANSGTSSPSVWSAAGQLVLRNDTISRTGTSNGGAALGASQTGLAAPTIDAQDVTIDTSDGPCMMLAQDSGASTILKDITATQDAPGAGNSFYSCVLVDRTSTLQNVTVNAPESAIAGNPVNGQGSGTVAAVAVGTMNQSSSSNVVLKNLTVNTRGTGLVAGPISGIQVRGGRFTGRFAGIQMFGATGVVSDAFTTGTDTNSYGLAATNGSSIKLRNLTAIGTGTRQGIYASDVGTDITIKNTIARGTGTGEDLATESAATMVVGYSNYVDSALLGGTGGLITETGGHQSGDPLFLNPALLDYHVPVNSPVVDAGTTDPDLGTTDIDGQPRIQDTAPDIGADERPAPPPPPPPPPPDGGGGGTTTTTTETTPTATTQTTTTTTTTGTQNIPGPVVTISAAAVKVTKTGVANIRIGCPATAAGSCTGTLALQTATPVSTAAKKKIVKLGSRSFKLGAGKQAFVGVKLNKQGLKLLKKLGRIRTKAIADVHDANGAARITQRLLSLKLR